MTDLRDKQIKAGAHDAAKQLGYHLTSYALTARWDGEVVYHFQFDAERQEATVDPLIDEAVVRRSGLSLREYIRLEILDALENPDV